MGSAIDKKFFYEGYKSKRKIFGGLSTSAFEALDKMLDRLSESKVFNTRAKIAFALGNMAKETKWSWKAVKEGYYLRVLTDKGRVNILYAYYWANNRGALKTIFPNGRDGVNYLGRCPIQLTHNYNYKWVGDELGIDLVGNPDLALDDDIGFKAMEVFIAKGLDEYFGERTFNYDTSFYYSRRLINGLDAAREIESYSKNFFDIIRFI